MVQHLHEGHRQRLKKLFLNTGLDGFEPHTALELLLFYAIPKQNTNDIAHELLHQLGTLSDVLNAPIEVLMEVKGIGEHAAILLKLLPQLFRMYADDMSVQQEVYDTTDKWIDFFTTKFVGRMDEVLYVAAVDDAAHLVGCELVKYGGGHDVFIPCTDLVKFTMRWHSERIVLSHNHPHGVAMPSRNDKYITHELQESLRKVGITVLDHIIVGRKGDGLSMREYGMLKG